MQSTASEHWAPIKGFEGIYEISTHGRVKSLARVVPYVDGRAVLVPERILRPQRNSGYLFVILKVAQVAHHRAVHRLVAAAFVPGEADGLDVCHKDGDKLNNDPSNLRWDTRSSNILDQVKHGTHREARKTHCVRGHEFSGTNVISTSRGRLCRECERIRSAAKRARRMQRKEVASI